MVAREFEALEKQIFLRDMVERANEVGELSFVIGDHLYTAGIHPPSALAAIKYGDPYYFAEPIADLLSRQADVEKDPWVLQPEMVPAPQGFFWFAKSVGEYRDPGLRRSTKPIQIRAAAWTIHKVTERRPNPKNPEVDNIKIWVPSYGGGDVAEATGVVIHFFGEIDGKLVPAGYSVWSYGKDNLALAETEWKLHGITEGSQDPYTFGGRDAALIACAWTFIQQKLIFGVPTRGADRTTRRRLERAGYSPEPFVRVVRLRRHKTNDYIPSENTAEIEYHCQWLVHGHKRNHCMHPHLHREGGCRHQLIYIAPYWKGPEDQPPKPSQINLYNVKD